MNFGHQPIDPEHPIGHKVARDAIPGLRAEARKISALAGYLGVRVDIYQAKVEASMATLAPRSPEDSIDITPAVWTSLEVNLTGDQFDETEALIKTLQDQCPDSTVDEIINSIFIHGLHSLPISLKNIHLMGTGPEGEPL